MPKASKKPRGYRCQGINPGDKRCTNKAFFETTKCIGETTWKVPIKVKLCIPCDKIFVNLTRPPSSHLRFYG